MILEKTRSRSQIPRPHKPTKRRKALNRKRKFKANDNPLKTYKGKHSLEEVRRYATYARQERLSCPTEGELGFARILDGIECKYEKEKIITYANGTRFIIIDFILKERNIAVEIDGGVHKQQHLYDRERDLWLAKNGTQTIRFTNSEVLKNPQAVIERLKEVINGE